MRQERLVVVRGVNLGEQKCLDLVVNDAPDRVTIMHHHIVGRPHNVPAIAKVNHCVSGKQAGIFELLSDVKRKRTANVVQRKHTVFFVDDQFVAKLKTVEHMSLGASQ